MQKILYALGSAGAEETLSKGLVDSDFIKTGTVGYREGIIPALQTSAANILLYSESLGGTIDHFSLMRKIRTTFPQVRIIFIAKEQPTLSKFLCQLVSLGIYDIINSNSPHVSLLIDHVCHPRDFSYASKFFREDNLEDLVPRENEQAPAQQKGGKKKSLFGLLNKVAPPTSAPEPQAALPAPAPAPAVDLDAMRSAILEEARRTAQAEIPTLVSMQVDQETAALKTDISKQKATILNLNQDIKEKAETAAALKKQLDDAKLLKKSAEDQLSKFQQDSQAAIQSYEAQLLSLQTTKPPEWYQEQSNKWLAEKESLKAEALSHAHAVTELRQRLQAVITEKERLAQALEAKTLEFEALQLAVPRDLSTAIDDALEDDFIPIPDNDLEYKLPAAGESRVLAFVGTKHGVGNTTVALNTAIALANCGYKTLFIELNRQFPLVNEFFEFSNIVRGLDTAIKALQQNNTKLASQCIVKPHGIQTQKKALSKIYKRLPGPLHFLLYSNDFLLQCKDGDAPHMTERELKDLTYFLTMQEHYSYVIFDIQPDDQESVHALLNSSYHVNQLVMTMTQDPHSITTAGYMITNLARSRNSALVRSAEFVINQYAPTNKMAAGKIGDFLHVPASRINKISLDSKGYMDSSFSAVPYLLSKGKFSNEYIDLRMKLSR